MRILLIAYACEPNKGSEPGVGWRWAVELSKMGRDVHVVTRANNKQSIEAECAKGSIGDRLSFHYLDLASALWIKRLPGGIYFYYTMWQLAAALFARRLRGEHKFDWIQHITFGVFRHSHYLWLAGVPIVFGPIGGGEESPLALTRLLGMRAVIKELVRRSANLLTMVNPFLQYSIYRSSVVILKNVDTFRYIWPAFHWKCKVSVEIGSDPSENRSAPRWSYGQLRLVYVGRFLYWKGVEFGLLAAARAVMAGVDIQIRLIGKGPELEKWMTKAEQLGIGERVAVIGWVPRSELIEHYQWSNVLLFPSLHDSSGNVLMEAMSYGLPALCLDVGGPGEIICRTGAGVAIDVKGAVIERLAQEMVDLSRNRERYDALAAAAGRGSQAMTWSSAVSAVWPGN